MKYAFYSDTERGWLKVLTHEIEMLAIAPDISDKSYISADRKYTYLDSKKDSQIFVDAILAADWFLDFNAVRECTRYFHTDFASFIRELDSFAVYQLKKLKPQTFEM